MIAKKRLPITSEADGHPIQKIGYQSRPWPKGMISVNMDFAWDFCLSDKQRSHEDKRMRTVHPHLFLNPGALEDTFHK
jgi:hypothetical protein